jgi:hypothetical protein
MEQRQSEEIPVGSPYTSFFVLNSEAADNQHFNEMEIPGIAFA